MANVSVLTSDCRLTGCRGGQTVVVGGGCGQGEDPWCRSVSWTAVGRSYLMLVYCCSTWDLLDGSGTFVSNVGLLLFHLGLVGRQWDVRI